MTMSSAHYDTEHQAVRRCPTSGKFLPGTRPGPGRPTRWQRLRREVDRLVSNLERFETTTSSALRKIEQEMFTARELIGLARAMMEVECEVTAAFEHDLDSLPHD